MRQRVQTGICLLGCAIIAIASVAAQDVIPPAAPAQQAVPHNPDHADKAATWCAYHVMRRELAHAVSDCNFAVTVDPRDKLAYLNRGSMYLTYGDAAQALIDFSKAVELAPAEAIPHYNRGLARAALGQGQAAIEDYTTAITLKPDLAIAYHNRGVEHEVNGDRVKAVADYERALEIDPNLEPSTKAIKRLRGDL